MTVTPRCAILLFGVGAGLTMADDFAGPAACQPCHPQQHATQMRSHHALALRPIANTPLPELLGAQPLRERSGVSFTYQLTRDGLLATATQGNRRASGLLEWAFGSGAQASTPVGRIGNTYFEHRVSYYARAPGGRLTLGHPGTASPDPASALGIPQRPEIITQCFQCHATGVAQGPNLVDMIPGITCERCHGEAGSHVKSSAAMKPPPRSQAAVTALCGACHRKPGSAPVTTPEKTDPLSIRYAPVGLLASACYQNETKLTCLTCHDPHGNARRDTAYYEAKCVSCHSAVSDPPCKAGNASGCLTCHMPRRSPAPHLTFTDHRIRVYRNE